MSKKTVDIIGAGIGGLATAYYLSKREPDVHIRVWEKDSFPGGLASNFVVDGVELEKFYHHIFKRDEALQNLIADVGLANDLRWKPAATGSYYYSQPYRLSSPLDLLKFKPLPFIDRIKMGFIALHARTIKDWQSLDDITAKEYILKYGGNKVWDIVWEPLFKGKFGVYADNISAAWLWSKLVDRGSSRSNSGFEVLGYLKGGLGKMFNEIVQHLKDRNHEIYFNSEVLKSNFDGNEVTSIETTTGTFQTDYLVCASQLPDTVKIFPENFSFRSQLKKIDFLANACLILVLKKSLSSFYWTNVTDPEAPFVGVIEQTKWTGTDDFNKKHIAYISSYVTHDDPRLKMSKEELLNYYIPYIQKIFPHFSKDEIIELYKWSAPYTQPIVHTGYRHDVPDIKTPVENMFLCTMAQIYPNDRQVSNGIEMAIKTVEIIREKIKNAPKIITG